MNHIIEQGDLREARKRTELTAIKEEKVKHPHRLDSNQVTALKSRRMEKALFLACYVVNPFMKKNDLAPTFLDVWKCEGLTRTHDVYAPWDIDVEKYAS